MTEKESDKASGDDSISQEKWERLPPSPPDLPVPAWLAAYQGQFPDLDFSRYSLDRIMCIRDFLMRRFNEAAGGLMKLRTGMMVICFQTLMSRMRFGSCMTSRLVLFVRCLSGEIGL